MHIVLFVCFFCSFSLLVAVKGCVQLPAWPYHPLRSCQVELVWVREEERLKKLSHLLHVSGVRPTDTYIRISRNPYIQVSLILCEAL